MDIIGIAFAAIICGADTWVNLEAFGQAKREWFRSFWPLPHGFPSHDVTIDAMGTQTAIAEQMVAQGADDVLAVKDNQAQLAEDVAATFAAAERVQFQQVPHDYARTVAEGHGRLETRECWTISRADDREALRAHDRWAGLRSWPWCGPRAKSGTRSGWSPVTTFPAWTARPCASLLAATRSHWGNENDLHWRLDVAFREDASRVRVGHGPEDLATLRQMALNVLKQEKTAEIGLKAKRLKAGWDEAYLRRLLTAL